MKTINQSLTIFLLFISTAVLTSCSSDININDYIDKNSSLKLTINKTDTNTGLTSSDLFEISPNSDKFKKLIAWGNENKYDWKSTLASYVCELSVTQDNFNLLLLKHEGVVIGFTDKKGNGNQYQKIINKGDLDFLY